LIPAQDEVAHHGGDAFPIAIDRDELMHVPPSAVG
jgi:hypothetical protein